MITTTMLKALNKKRDNLIGILAIMVVPAPFVALGLGMVIGAILKGPLYIALPGLYFLTQGMVIGWVLFQRAYRFKQKSYTLFMKHDVYVDPKDQKLRAVEQLALEKFDGDLKQALRHVAEAPDFHRQERLYYMTQWCDYERDYIQQYYGKKPIRVAAVSKTDPLTIAVIEADLSRKYRNKQTVFTVKLASCSNKHTSYGTDGEPTRYYLLFHPHGSCECSQNLHSLTEKGDKFYIVIPEGSHNPVLAYSTAEWNANEAVEYLMSEE